VNGYSSLSQFTEIDKALYYVVTWRTAVQEEQFIVNKASVRKTSGIVHLLVQTYDVGNISFAKISKVRFRSMEWVTYSKIRQQSTVAAVTWHIKVMSIDTLPETDSGIMLATYMCSSNHFKLTCHNVR